MNLLRIADINSTPGFPLKAQTLYKWAHIGKHPEIFVKIGKSRFIDLDVFWQLARDGKLAGRG
jgi:hypothetical protein